MSEHTIPLDGRPVDLALLQTELIAAGVPVAGLTTGDDALTMLDADSEPIPPTPAAVAVVDAHVPPPRVIDHAGTTTVDAVVRTTDAAVVEVFRFATTARRVYRATLSMTAIDAVSGATRDSEVRLVFKRPSTAPSQVGSTVVLSNVQDAAASTWRILPSVDGVDLVISVSGADGRTVDWLLVGAVGAFAPGGLEG